MPTIQVKFVDQKTRMSSEIISIENDLMPDQLTQILNHLLKLDNKYKFTIKELALTNKLDEFIALYSIDTESTVQITYHEYKDEEHPDYSYNHNALISFSLKDNNVLMFSDYEGALNKLDMLTKETECIFKHTSAIYMFTSNINGTFFVDENNDILSTLGEIICKSDSKIILLSSNDEYLAFSNVKDEVYIYRYCLKLVQKLNTNKITNISSIICGNKLSIASQNSGLHIVNIENMVHDEIVCSEGINCMLDFEKNYYLGTFKGQIIRFDCNKKKFAISTEKIYVKNVAFQKNRLVYSDQYNVFVLSNCLTFSTHKFVTEDEISALFWCDDKLFVVSGPKIKSYRIDLT